MVKTMLKDGFRFVCVKIWCTKPILLIWLVFQQILVVSFSQNCEHRPRLVCIKKTYLDIRQSSGRPVIDQTGLSQISPTVRQFSRGLPAGRLQKYRAPGLGSVEGLFITGLMQRLPAVYLLQILSATNVAQLCQACRRFTQELRQTNRKCDLRQI